MEDPMIEEEQEQKKGFMSWLKGVFRKKDPDAEPEAPKYKRKLLDGRIEKYLDQNMDSYIQEYGIVTGLDLESYEIRYGKLTGRIAGMKEYQLSAEARISALERDLEEVKKAAKPKK
ncbi:MAG: hypothetical protein ACMUIE_06515 [Thermoplasmatota archaeon]